MSPRVQSCPKLSNHATVRAGLVLACALLLLPATLDAQPSAASSPTSCGTTNIPVSPEYPKGGNNWPDECFCNQQYALCIAASCDSSTGVCGVMLPSGGGDWVPCDQDGVDDGTCGVCYVFDGISQSDHNPTLGRPLTCDELAPSGNTVHSTYSSELLDSYGFEEPSISLSSCNVSSLITADCMGGSCTLNGSEYDISLSGSSPIPTANCNCVMSTHTSGSSTYTYQAMSGVAADCDAVWSVF